MPRPTTPATPASTPDAPVTARPSRLSALRGLARTARGGRVERPRSQPPAAPGGYEPLPPDFVGVGTARSGTTWWDALIHAHPDVVRLPGVPKEIHWFDRYWDGSFDEDAARDYSRFFARPAGSYAGEW